MEYKIGQVVNEYLLKIYENGKVETEKTLHEIIAVRDHEKRGMVLALTDEWQGIEVIQTNKDKDKMSTSINDSNIWENKWRSKSLTDSINGTIYTTQNDDKKVYKKLVKEIEKYLSKEYGKYCNYKLILEDIKL